MENGTRLVTPERTYRAYCPGCEAHISLCLSDHQDGLSALYGRLAAEIGEARQAEVLIKIPFGPSVPLSEAIDAHMREMTETMCSWEERARFVDHLSEIPLKVRERPQDSAGDLERSIRVIAPRMTVLLSLSPEPMVRVLPWWGIPEGAEILTGDGVMAKIITDLGGREAGQEILDLHYYARRLLLETNPPQPLLPDFRCRVCERKALRRAAPPWHESAEWFWSRCDSCGDEATREEYDVNARRWIAYEKAHLATPKLAA